MKHVLTIQDLSCVGECSIKAALPVLSVLGHETSILPVTLLSGHTAFQNVSVNKLENELNTIVDAWQKERIQFDCILSGYLSNQRQVEVVMQAIEKTLKKEGLYVCDPAMADHGKLYRGFDEDFVESMKQLASRADILLPNVTEACLLSGLVYQDEQDEQWADTLLTSLEEKYDASIIMTGVSFKENKTGIMVSENKHHYVYRHEKEEGSFFGTGDLFSSVFTGSYLNQKGLLASAARACDFVKKSIEVTDKSHWYGVQFEKVLGTLADGD